MPSCADPVRLIAALAICGLAATVVAQSQDAALYKEALTREAALREELAALRGDAASALLVERIRVMVGAYDDLAQLFPDSDYGDNALWQGGILAADLFARSEDPADRDTALALLNELVERFPSSPLRAKVPEHLTRLAALPSAGSRPVAARPPAAQPPPPAAPPPAPAVLLRGLSREVLPEVVRVTLDLEREVMFTGARLSNPPRVVIDLLNVRPSPALANSRLPIGGMVRQAQVTHVQTQTRVVFDVAASVRHSTYLLYNPYRIVVDFEHGPDRSQAAAPRTAPPRNPSADGRNAARVLPLPALRATPPASPAANASGGFSLSRQLGLGVTRIAIDPGHGGHDPGAEVSGLTEAGLVLDVALRVEELLKKEERVEVVLTRRTNAYVSLDERTAIANRTEADLFLSIHANANAAAGVRGVETYFLNFAPNPAAEALAARENAASSRSMRDLPDLVEAIALNNKREESRDFATTLQATLYERLRKVNRNLKNLGVKQAPFVVLVGAGMPAILAEIAFMTNAQEALLLKTARYRQRIAEALVAAVMRYQERLKKTGSG
jgi:N-acetylmuramoyl-L-alanine amidase